LGQGQIALVRLRGFIWHIMFITVSRSVPDPPAVSALTLP